MATIYEVAALARVSPATVSRVFNGVSVTPALAERVEQAALTLGFTPNRAARSLRRQTSEVIGLIIPDIENPFFTSLARGVEDRAMSAGYSLVLCNSDDEFEKERRYVDIVRSEKMAGVILAPTTPRSNLDLLIDQGIPVVAVDRSSKRPRIDSVLMDNEVGGREATQLLYGRGFHRVACITGPATIETAKQRAEGWRRVFAAHHRRLEADKYLRWADYRVLGGREAMEDLLAMRNPPDAVFVSNNFMAVGALQVLTEHGRQRDFGVVAFGDLPFRALEMGGVSVVHLPAREMGSIAAELLLERILGSTRPARKIIVPNEFSAGSDGAVTTS